MAAIQSSSGRTVEINGRSYLHFSGTGYLGMAHRPAFQALVSEGMSHYGANYGGSRLSTLQYPVFAQAEDLLAQQMKAPAALTLSSGSLAGQLVVRYLEQFQQPMYFAPGTHPALWGNGKHSTLSYTEWTKQILELSQQSKAPIILFSNSVDPLRVEQFSFEWLTALPKDRITTVVIDDSHGIGILGEEGKGGFDRIPKATHLNILVVASLGKALAIPGGSILGSKTLIEALRQSPFFGGASPCLPAYLHAYIHAQPLYRSAWFELVQKINFLQSSEALKNHFQYLPRYPVFHTIDDNLAPWLRQQGVIISSFPYPTPHDPCITRVVVNSLHTLEDLQELTQLLQYYREKYQGK